LIISQRALEHLRISVPEPDFELGLKTFIDSIESKKTKLILANHDPLLQSAVSLFLGTKTVAANELESEQDLEDWAAHAAVEQLL
jgi:hypothetical protein